jgi:hypothetical protein
MAGCGMQRSAELEADGGVLKWGGSPKHPKLDHFSIETHGLGYPEF